MFIKEKRLAENEALIAEVRNGAWLLEPDLRGTVGNLAGVDQALPELDRPAEHRVGREHEPVLETQILVVVGIGNPFELLPPRLETDFGSAVAHLLKGDTALEHKDFLVFHKNLLWFRVYFTRKQLKSKSKTRPKTSF